MDEMIEKAKEELTALETLHPNQFHYLKLELQSFISLLHSQQTNDSLPCASSATTQASTSMKRKRKRIDRDRVDAVLDKAEACVRKIREFKKYCLIC